MTLFDEPDDALELARQYDAFFDQAEHDSPGMFPPPVFEWLEPDAFRPYRAVPFVDAYGRGGLFPADRLPELLHRLVDVRLQLWYMRYDTGLYNREYWDLVNLDPTLGESPKYMLRLMAIDQSMISRSRIAWEKYMRFVHYLATGEDLKPTNNRSYKKKFFQWVETAPAWEFLLQYVDIIDNHDGTYRTGEFHKGSILRPRILGRSTPQTNEFLDLYNHMSNAIWPNTLNVLLGKEQRARFDIVRSDRPAAP